MCTVAIALLIVLFVLAVVAGALGYALAEDEHCEWGCDEFIESPEAGPCSSCLDVGDCDHC